MRARSGNRWWVPIAICLTVLGAVLIPSLRGPSEAEPLVVVYCAHDAIFADEILRQFEQDTGIRVQVRFDEEASKSLGLTNLLISERDRPRCDVFWNNQTLGTMRLKDQNVLASYKGPGYDRIPSAFRDPEGYWTGFAARLRVYVVNDALAADPEAIAAALDADDLSDVAIAKPLFGTTLTHYTALAHELGLDGLQNWHRSLHERGIREARGNSAVKDLVAEGVCRLGFTDTDDVFVAIDQGKSVRMIPARVPSGATICIPNTVAMIRDCPHPEEAQRLIDYLLSETIEMQLAHSRSRQIPLGPVELADLPEEVRALQPAAADGCDLNEVFSQHQAVLDWLSAEYLP